MNNIHGKWFSQQLTAAERDPLSPFILILEIDVFMIAMQKTNENDLIIGISIGHLAKVVSRTEFANDIGNR